MRLDAPIAILAAALAAACTPMQWVKQDATPEQLREDSIQCQQDAWLEADPYMEEVRLTQFCMRNKGYALQAVEKPKEQVEPTK